jgi:hypothetical protein
MVTMGNGTLLVYNVWQFAADSAITLVSVPGAFG